jgi:hypothetical protein
MTIIVNSAQCLICGIILTSNSVHDFKSCECPNQMSVDGGKSYIKRGAVYLDMIKDLSVICDNNECRDCLRICSGKDNIAY